MEDEDLFLSYGYLVLYESQNKGHYEDNLGHGTEREKIRVVSGSNKNHVVGLGKTRL